MYVSGSVRKCSSIVGFGCTNNNYKTIGKKLTPDDNSQKRQRNYQNERSIQKEGGKPESCTKRQDVDVQKQLIWTKAYNISPLYNRHKVMISTSTLLLLYYKYQCKVDI